MRQTKTSGEIWSRISRIVQRRHGSHRLCSASSLIVLTIGFSASCFLGWQLPSKCLLYPRMAALPASRWKPHWIREHLPHHDCWSSRWQRHLQTVAPLTGRATKFLQERMWKQQGEKDSTYYIKKLNLPRSTQEIFVPATLLWPAWDILTEGPANFGDGDELMSNSNTSRVLALLVWSKKNLNYP